MYLLLAGNDTVPLSMWHDGGIHFTEYSLVTATTRTHGSVVKAVHSHPGYPNLIPAETCIAYWWLHKSY